MLIQSIDRVRDKDGRSQHAASVTTDAGVIHADHFPHLFVGIHIEEEMVMINGQKQKCYMPTDLGVCANKLRPSSSGRVNLYTKEERRANRLAYQEKKAKKNGKSFDPDGIEENPDDVVLLNLEQLRRDTMFYYSVKDFLSFRDINRLVFSRNNKGFKDIYEVYERMPYELLCLLTTKFEDYFHLFPQICKLQIPKTFEERLNEYRYGARYLLRHMEQNGDTWMPYGEFRDQFYRLFEQVGKPMRYGSPRAVLEYFDEFTIDPKLTDEAKVFRTETKLREMDILNIIDQYRNVASPYRSFDPTEMSDFEDEQRDAILHSVICKGRLSIITGGPGVGKTTVLRKIIDTMREQYPDIQVRFLASTGKAANRIKEALGNPPDVTIKTVHKFLHWGQETIWTEENVREVKDSGLVIVDESSMMDLLIFSKLINALDMQKTKIILVGDCDQLPSVEMGNILSDMIALGVPCFRLCINHRNNGVILENAKKIISGDPFLKEDDCFRIVDAAPSVGWLQAGLCVVDAEKMVDENGEKREIAAFSPYRTEKIDGSTADINKTVQEAIFKGDRKYKCGDRFYVGDRVVMTQTNYEARYFNGDIGVLEQYSRRNGFMVSINGEIRNVADESHMDLAYSLTIHKSQGSEYDEVLITIPKYTPFITRRMLYTAVTRAKSRVTIFASKETIRQVILNNKDRNRRTFLAEIAKKREEEANNKKKA